MAVFLKNPVDIDWAQQHSGPLEAFRLWDYTQVDRQDNAAAVADCVVGDIEGLESVEGPAELAKPPLPGNVDRLLCRFRPHWVPSRHLP